MILPCRTPRPPPAKTSSWQFITTISGTHRAVFSIFSMRGPSETSTEQREQVALLLRLQQLHLCRSVRERVLRRSSLKQSSPPLILPSKHNAGFSLLCYTSISVCCSILTTRLKGSAGRLFPHRQPLSRLRSKDVSLETAFWLQLFTSKEDIYDSSTCSGKCRKSRRNAAAATAVSSSEVRRDYSF